MTVVHEDPALERALERLALAAMVREVAGLRREVKFRNRPRAARLAAGLVAWAGRGPGGASARRRAAAMALRLVAGGTHARHPFAGLGALAPEAGDAAALPVAAWLEADDETALVRHALLQRLAGRHGTAVALLRARLRSGRPAARTRRWLAFHLEEVGEKKMAARLAEAGQALPPAGSPRPPRPPRVSAALVMLTMGDSEVFRASLASLARSDFDGEVVVVEDGDHEGAHCERACRDAGVGYHRNEGWVGNAASLNAGLARLGGRPEVAVVAHNDLLWPERWWQPLESAWADVLPGGRVGLLNLPYLQCGPRPESVLAALFTDGAYDDLAWLLERMRGLPALAPVVEHATVPSDGRRFGLSRDVWNDRPEALRPMVGRFSVAASFPVSLWRDLGAFDPALVYGCDLQLQHACLRRRLWMLWVAVPPLLHLVSSDTKSLDAEHRRAFSERLTQTNRAFKLRYGTSIERFLACYFSETAVVHADAIVRAANDGRFEDVDHVFDEFWRRFEGRADA